MGLLDDLYIGHNANFGGQGGGLLDFLRTSQMQQDQYQPSAGFPQPSPMDNAQWPYGPNNGPSALDNAQWPSGPVGAPANFADRFNAMPGAPQPFQGAGRSFDTASFDPSTYAPNQAQPISVGNYQMPRIGSADQFAPPMNAMAQLPQNAQPTQGQLPQQAPPMQAMQAPQQQTAPTFLNNSGGLGAGLRGFVNNLHTGPLGAILGGLGNAAGMQSPAQQNLKAQFDSLRQSLIENGETPQAANSKAMLAVMNPEAAKTVIPELLSNKADWGVIREDPISGAKVMGWINKRDQTINGQPMSAGTSATGDGSVYLNKGVGEYDPALPGDQYLQQFAPDVQSAIKAFARGDSQPTGNARKGWAENIKKWATAWGDKTGQQVNDQTFYEKKKLKTDLGASGNSTMGGILDNGESSFAHLAELGKSFSDLGSISHNFPGGGYLAQGQNAIGSAFGGSDTKGKIVSAKQNLTKYGQESTKFYAGTGGGVEERMAALKTVPPESSSGEEQAAYMEKEKQLMLDRLNNKFDHIRQTLGEEEGNKVIAKKLPTINQNIEKIDASIKKLRGEEAASGTSSNPQIESLLKKYGGK